MSGARLSTRAWIALLTAVVLALVVCAFALRQRSPGTIARVYVDGVCVREIDLSALASDMSFTVETERGVNAIEARPGGIRIASADCPDQVCVRFGWLTGGTTPIVCLPHRVVVQLEGGASETGGVDAISG